MARARNIKPGFFKNDDLAQCEFGARLLFAGLWTLADREGRLEDRPARIKAELFPYDQCDVDKWLIELAEWEFITRYEVDGRKYIQVNTFKTHQNPHCKESASTIPAPCEHGTSRADSLLLIPDSPILIPDSGLPESGAAAADPQTGKSARPKFVSPTVDEVRTYCTDRKNSVDPEKFVNFYASKGWKVGSEKMVDWKASVRTWEKNNGSSHRGSQQSARVGPGQRYRE